MIIVFFVGLIIMASGGSISETCNISCLNLICNIVGGIMMGSSTYWFIKEEEKKKNELKLLTEKLVGKEEHENEINVLVSIETLLKNHSKVLSSIEENQKRVINIVSNSSEIADSITTIKGSLDNHFSILEKEISNQNKRVEKSRAIQINEVIERISILSEKNAKGFEKILIAINNADNMLDKIQVHANDIIGRNSTIVEYLKTIERRAEGINKFPQEIDESVDRLISNFGSTISSIQNNYKNLVEDIDEQEKKRTEKFCSIMNEIRDNADDYNEEMSEEIKNLSDQYASFENMISVIVEQMSHMAEEDIKVMKGFLNG